MVQLFEENGRAVAATIVEAGPCTVVRVRAAEGGDDGVVQLGFGEVKESKLTKPLAGHFQKAGVAPKKYLKEVKIGSEDEYKVGDEIRADVFSAGQRVDVTGISRGKGFAGMVKRWNASGGPGSHGSMFHRRPGSVGASASPARVFKGKKLPGHLGNSRVTAMNLEVLKVRPEENLVLVRGSVPGPAKGLVFLRRSLKQKGKKAE
jgi:large subunit ribosomal protein L3